MRKYNFILSIILTFLTKPLFGVGLENPDLTATASGSPVIAPAPTIHDLQLRTTELRLPVDLMLSFLSPEDIVKLSATTRVNHVAFTETNAINHLKKIGITLSTHSGLSSLPTLHKIQIFRVLPKMLIPGMFPCEQSKVVQTCQLILKSSLALDPFAGLIQRLTQNPLNHSNIIDKAYAAARTYWESISHAE